MTHDEIIYARVPGKLKSAIERERKRLSRTSGSEVKESEVIRSILEQRLLPKRRPETAAALR